VYQKAADRSELLPAHIHPASLADGTQVALYDIDGTVFATTDHCPHDDCLLSEAGEIYDDVVECSCHGSGFDIASGRNVNPPAADSLAVFAVELRGNEVFVESGS
jgi:p-cumate 2,3-dioxygenase ferredoxin subunit